MDPPRFLAAGLLSDGTGATERDPWVCRRITAASIEAFEGDFVLGPHMAEALQVRRSDAEAVPRSEGVSPVLESTNASTRSVRRRPDVTRVFG